MFFVWFFFFWDKKKRGGKKFLKGILLELPFRDSDMSLAKLSADFSQLGDF